MNRIKRIVLILSPLLLLVVGVGYYQGLSQTKVVHQLSAEHCQIDRTSCQITLDANRSIEVDITPRGIPQVTPLQLKVTTKGFKASVASITFEGIEIDHHLPAYRLYAQKNNQVFVGKGFLSLCTLSKMHWLAHVEVQSKQGHYRASLPFVTYKP